MLADERVNNKMQKHYTSQALSRRSIFWGLTSIVGGFFLLFGLIFVAIISKVLPPFENRWLSAAQNDRYYCLLLPLTLPVLIVSVYFHWLSMKLFKHA